LFKANAKIETKSNVDMVKKFLDDLGKTSVMVGVPEGTAARGEGNLTNAQLAFLHTEGARSRSMRREMDASGLSYTDAHKAYIRAHGSPLYAIPPRPFLQPAVEAPETKAKITGHITKGIAAALDGNAARADSEFELAGLLGANAAKRYIDDGSGLLPNAPATVARKEKKHRGDAPGPLIDTGALKRSITYAVRKGG
jgi:hypothetical protein